MLRVLSLVLCLCAGTVQAQCRLSLILALDVSGSVDAREYRLQLDGVAAALDDPAVRAALLDPPERPVAVAVFEWSGGAYQRLIQDWVTLTGPEVLNALTARLRQWQRAPAPNTTALGAAMTYAMALQGRAPDCRRRVVDISGDGTNNGHPLPDTVRASGILAGTTVNALVIGAGPSDAPDGDLAALIRYFRARILHGPDAFVETASGYEDYADAMTRKLLREVQTLPVSLLDRGNRIARQ